MKTFWFAFLAALVLALPALPAGADDVLTIPAGSTLQVRLTTTLSTRTNQNGDPWTANVVEPIIGNGGEVVPAGSLVEGHVTLVKPPGRAKGVAEMRLVADTITTPDEIKFSVSAGLEDAHGADGSRVEGEEGTIKGAGKSKKGGAIETGVGAGVGAGTGAIIDGGQGALYGAAIGAGAAVIHSMMKHHKDIVLPQGSELTFVINRTITTKKSPPPADAPK